MKIKVNRIIKNTRMEGFGNRYCIWTQGCSIRCNGCANRHMWSQEGGFWKSIEEILLEWSELHGLEGVTFLGGEPLDQKEEVGILAEEARKRGLSVIVFTGYSYDNLRLGNDNYIQRILNNTDLLIDGPFIESELDYSRPWVGSKNQRYFFLSNRYNQADLEKQRGGQKYELRIYPDGAIAINGMGNTQILENLLTFKKEVDYGKN